MLNPMRCKPIALLLRVRIWVNVGVFGHSITNLGGSVILGDGGGNALPLRIFV